jgi:RecJ-like exonuclease
MDPNYLKVKALRYDYTCRVTQILATGKAPSDVYYSTREILNNLSNLLDDWQVKCFECGGSGRGTISAGCCGCNGTGYVKGE